MTDDLCAVLEEIAGVAETVDRGSIEALVEALVAAPRVFVTGEGRSGLMGKAFAMRLMHLGVVVHVVGETVTPAVAAGDLVVAVSGSGTTAGTLRAVEAARGAGATVAAVTTDPSSALGRLADAVLVLPAATKHRRAGEATTVQPLGSLFDQGTHVVLDAVCLGLARVREVGNDRARATHANTE